MRIPEIRKYAPAGRAVQIWKIPKRMNRAAVRVYLGERAGEIGRRVYSFFYDARTGHVRVILKG